jgi:hypothetical protein
MLRQEQSHGTRKLYHATTLPVAQEIKRTKTLSPGSKGMLGPGIYLAETLEAAKGKCRNYGAVLEMDVNLGVQYVVNAAMPDLTRREVEQSGCNSVKGIGFRTGTEYVVYDAWRIQNIGIVHVWVKDGGNMSFRRSVPAEQDTAMRIQTLFDNSTFIFSGRGGTWNVWGMCL